MAFAGVMLDTSFARFMASIATFREEGIPPRSFGRLDSTFMNQVQAVAGIQFKVEAANKDVNPNRDGRSPCHHHTWRADRPESLPFLPSPLIQNPRCFYEPSGATSCLQPYLAFSLVVLDPSRPLVPTALNPTNSDPVCFCGYESQAELHTTPRFTMSSQLTPVSGF